MQPIAPAANPTTSNSNLPYGGFGQAQSDYGTAAGILNYLPTQESQTTSAATNANTNPGSILPNVSINAPTYTAPSIPSINPSGYTNNLAGYNNAVQGAESSLLGSENSIYNTALGTLQGAEQKYGNLTPVYQNLASEYNIPGYQSDISTLSGLLQNLNRDVNAQTTLGGGLMTESARDEAYANQAQPLNTALTTAGQFLNYGQNDVANLLDTYEKSLTNALNPLETNIQNLPTVFGQTNQAAQSGYDQGATALQNMIQNALYNRQLTLEFGNGGGVGGAGAGTPANNPLQSIFTSGGQGVALKNTKTGAAGGYNFTVSGKPASAIDWAQANNYKPSDVIKQMAQAGDTGAQAALAALSANPNMSKQEMEQRFPSLAWQPSAPPSIVDNFFNNPKEANRQATQAAGNAAGGLGNFFGGLFGNLGENINFLTGPTQSHSVAAQPTTTSKMYFGF
jgi:hypothetical protein